MLINLKYLPAPKKPKLKWRSGEGKVEGNEMITEARFLLHLFELCASFKSFCGTYFYSFFFHSCLAKKKWCINCAKVSAKIAFRYCKAAHSEVLPLLWYFIFHIHALHSRKRGSRWANLNCKLGRSLRLLWTPPHWLLPLAVSWATTTPPYHCTNPIRPLCPGHFFGILSCHIFCNFQVTRHENNAKVILSQGTAMPFAFRISLFNCPRSFHTNYATGRKKRSRSRSRTPSQNVLMEKSNGHIHGAPVAVAAASAKFLSSACHVRTIAYECESEVLIGSEANTFPDDVGPKTKQLWKSSLRSKDGEFIVLLKVERSFFLLSLNI